MKKVLDVVNPMITTAGHADFRMKINDVSLNFDNKNFCLIVTPRDERLKLF